jgi:hypothetical protein
MAHFSDTIRRISSADGAIVLDLARGTMFRLNLTGSKILDLLEQGVSPAKVAKQLSVEWDVPIEVVQNDLSHFMQSLQIHRLIDSLAENS